MKILFCVLGCDKNLVDSEKMLAFLKKHGHELTEDEAEAEAAVVNTCCFIHDAQTESIETILRLGELKNTASLKYLVVIGCLAERFRDEILDSIPEVDAVIGTNAYDELANVIADLENRTFERRTVTAEPSHVPVLDSGRLLSGITHYAYLKIAEGCNKRCTYCVIPDIKGRYRSEDFDSLVSEARFLAEQGTRELIVIAQETTVYGVDLYGKKRLPELLEKLSEIEGIEWIRLMYCYPEEVTDELIEAIGKLPKVCHYIDMPIQHCSDSILKRMGRRTDKAQILDIISRLRKAVPDIVIRTSLITGFPGETEEDHRELLNFINTCRLDRVGVFRYSREKGTPAYKMKEQVPERIKKSRQKELMLAQQKVVFDKNKALAGKTLNVIVDGRIPGEDVYIGRSYMDAPDVDGCVFVEAGGDIVSGTVMKVRIDDFKDYDLIGTCMNE